MTLEHYARCVVCRVGTRLKGKPPTTDPELLLALPESWTVGSTAGKRWIVCSDRCHKALTPELLERFYGQRMSRLKGVQP